MKPLPPEDDFLDALRRSPRAEAPPFLYTRVQARLQAASDRLQTVPPRKLAWVAAAAVALIMLNVAAWRQLSHRSVLSPAAAGQLGSPALNLYSSGS
jgi:hypothetical protein